MGTTYYVACLDCHHIEDLDKFWRRPIEAFETRAEALECTESVIEAPLAFAIFTAFMSEHSMHRCQVFSEYNDEDFCDILREYTEERWEQKRKSKCRPKWSEYSYKEIHGFVYPKNKTEDLWRDKNDRA